MDSRESVSALMEKLRHDARLQNQKVPATPGEEAYLAALPDVADRLSTALFWVAQK